MSDSTTLGDIEWRPPELASERLLLRGFEPSDAPAVYDYASDLDVTPYMAWDRFRRIDEAYAFLNGYVAGGYEERELIYALCLRSAPDEVIGAIDVRWHSRRHRVMEIGYVLAKAHWGRGLVPEAGRLLIRYAFSATEVFRIYAPIFADNAKSRRAAEKMGMTLDGVLRSALELRGRRWDEAIYSILRE